MNPWEAGRSATGSSRVSSEPETDEHRVEGLGTLLPRFFVGLDGSGDLGIIRSKGFQRMLLQYTEIEATCDTRNPAISIQMTPVAEAM